MTVADDMRRLNAPDDLITLAKSACENGKRRVRGGSSRKGFKYSAEDHRLALQHSYPPVVYRALEDLMEGAVPSPRTLRQWNSVRAPNLPSSV